jgi:transcriptional regulator of met regulon
MIANMNQHHGEKGDFRKITVTIPPGAYEQLIHESARRKIAGEPNQLLSSLLREAVIDYLKRLEK